MEPEPVQEAAIYYEGRRNLPSNRLGYMSADGPADPPSAVEGWVAFRRAAVDAIKEREAQAEAEMLSATEAEAKRKARAKKARKAKRKAKRKADSAAAAAADDAVGSDSDDSDDSEEEWEETTEEIVALLVDSILHSVHIITEEPVVDQLWMAVSGGKRPGDDAGPLHRGREKRHVNYRIDGLVGAIEYQDTVLNGPGLIPSGPFKWWMIDSLVRLQLVRNGLGGHLPGELFEQLPKLQCLWLSSNQLRGVLPAQLSNAHNLRELNLDQNDFSGDLSALAGLLGLQHLDVSHCSFVGRADACLPLPVLVSMRGCGNELTGELDRSVDQ